MSIERLREHPVLRYALAVIAAGATIAALIPLRFLIEPLPSPPFLLMVMVVAWLAGFGPAIVSVIISALALDYWFVPPLGALVTGPILAQRCGCGNYVSRLARQAERLRRFDRRLG